MTKQEQIEKMVSIMAASNNPFVDVPIEIMPKVAEALCNEGYHKTVWHKVADGDLPKQENGDVIAIPVQVCYKNEIGIKCNGPCYFFFITGNFRELNSAKTLDVIAWTELPKYEENIDERR